MKLQNGLHEEEYKGTYILLGVVDYNIKPFLRVIGVYDTRGEAELALSNLKLKNKSDYVDFTITKIADSPVI